MKICILTPRFPFPENGGDVLRINSIARYLKTQKHELVLCSFVTNKYTDSEKKAANELYDKIYTIRYSKINSFIHMVFSFISNKPLQCGYYSSGKFSKKFRKIIKDEKCDLFISHLLRMTPYLEKNKLEKQSIVEMTDALSKTYELSQKNKGFSIKKIIYVIERKRIKKYEQHVIKKFKKVVLVSRTDIDYLGDYSNLSLHTNGINCFDNNSITNAKKICFVGNMRTLQNQDAVIHFVTNIFPIISAKYPDIQFHIVGAEPPVSIENLADNKRIFVTGFVESVENYILDSNLIIAPVNIAAGIQNKVLIGMACKIPVVLSSLIAKSIPELKSGENCYIADDPFEFAEVCMNLISDKELRDRIAKKGFEMVKEHYSWHDKLMNYEIIR